MSIGSRSILFVLVTVLALCAMPPVMAQSDIIDINVIKPGGGGPEPPADFTGTYMFKVNGNVSNYPIYGVMTLNDDGCATSSSLIPRRGWVYEETPTHGVWEDLGQGRLRSRLMTMKLDAVGDAAVFQRVTLELHFNRFMMVGDGTLIVESYSPRQIQTNFDPNTSEPPEFGTRRGSVKVHRLVPAT